jgi:hypothetical protein
MANETIMQILEAGIEDAGPAWTQGRKFVSSADMSAGADLTDAPEASKKIVIDDILLSSSNANAIVVTLEEETSGADLWKINLPAGGVPGMQITLRGKLKLATANKKLRGVASAAGQVDITVLYHSEA